MSRKDPVTPSATVTAEYAGKVYSGDYFLEGSGRHRMVVLDTDLGSKNAILGSLEPQYLAGVLLRELLREKVSPD